MIKAQFVLLLFCAVSLASVGYGQRLDHSGFTERSDTLIVHAAGVVLLTASETALDHAFDSARNAADSASIARALYEYRSALSAIRQQFDAEHIPNLTTACRFIEIVGDKQVEVFDRRKLVGPDSLELYDAFVSDGRGVVRFLTDLQQGDTHAWIEVLQVLHRTP